MATAEVVTMPFDITVINNQANSAQTQLSKIGRIETAEQYEQAADLVKFGLTVLETIDETFDDHIAQAHQLHKGLLATKKRFADPVNAGVATVKQLIGDYQIREERRRKDEEERVAHVALKAQQESMFQEAQRVAAEGNHEEAEQIVNEALTAPAPTVIIPRSVTRVQGVSRRENWQFRIVDESKIPDEYWVVDEKKLASTVKSFHKKAEAMVPGIEVYDAGSVIVRK